MYNLMTQTRDSFINFIVERALICAISMPVLSVFVCGCGLFKKFVDVNVSIQVCGCGLAKKLEI